MYINQYNQRVFENEQEAMDYATGKPVVRADSQHLENKYVPSGNAKVISSEKVSYGLMRHEVIRDSGWGRHTCYEYESLDGRKHWMSEFQKPVFQQVRLANSNRVAEEIRNGITPNYTVFGAEE